ncbi:MAG TPA: sugar transferase [Kineosporiaceae bacterium]
MASLLGLDVVAFFLGGLVGQLARFATLSGDYRGIAYRDLLLATAPVWVLTLTTARTYEPRYLGMGSEEFHRVGNAAARFTALLAVVVFVFKWDLARGLIAIALPTAALLTLTLRYLARQLVHRIRRHGLATHRVLLVGDDPARQILAHRLRTAPHSGLRVVAHCPPISIDPTNPSAPAGITHIRQAVQHAGADTVAVCHCPDLHPDTLRQLAWSLEGLGVDLLVAPALTDVAGPRISIRPVSGLPLLQIAEPEFTGVRRVLKRLLDITLASLGLIATTPLLLVIALTIRLTTPGPVLFRQTRIGRGGHHFTMYKFRSMYTDAETRLTELATHNDHTDGVLFKMRHDPRITAIGRHLRRYSLDELPQLLNVVAGHMSMVGPRPPLPHEVARYEPDTHRRLLVKPGLTGLWQVSGRSDLPWHETVRLDLYYVENWSVALDTEIIWKTIGAVLRGKGAR